LIGRAEQTAWPGEPTRQERERSSFAASEFSHGDGGEAAPRVSLPPVGERAKRLLLEDYPAPVGGRASGHRRAGLDRVESTNPSIPCSVSKEELCRPRG